MGRRKVELTQEQIEERRKRYWGPERNAKRRAQYHADDALKQRIIQTVRAGHRKRQEDAGVPVRNDDCRERISQLAKIACTRSVDLGETWVRMPCLTIEELGRAIGRNTQVLYRWINADMFPGPALPALNEHNRTQVVYSVGEVTALLEVFGAHQERSQYYKEKHTETRRALFDAVRREREKLGVVKHERDDHLALDTRAATTSIDLVVAEGDRSRRGDNSELARQTTAAPIRHRSRPM
jgi:hypothetical protein